MPFSAISSVSSSPRPVSRTTFTRISKKPKNIFRQAEKGLPPNASERAGWIRALGRYQLREYWCEPCLASDPGFGEWTFGGSSEPRYTTRCRTLRLCAHYPYL